jgi:transcription initiation factor IIE alpha subunit
MDGRALENAVRRVMRMVVTAFHGDECLVVVEALMNEPDMEIREEELVLRISLGLRQTREVLNR